MPLSSLSIWRPIYAFLTLCLLTSTGWPQETRPATSPTRTQQAATSPTATQPQAARIWKQMELRGAVVENAPPFVMFGAKPSTVREFREQLDRVAKDERVEGVLLRIVSPEMGYARVEEVRREIERFRARGKQIHAILYDGNQAGYLIAAGCDRVTMVPTGILMLTGLRVEGLFLKNLLDRVGVDTELISIGKYKDAGEMLTRAQWSQPAREAMEALADDLFEQMIRLIAEGRNLAPDEVRKLIDEGPYTADEALKHNLVDQLAYEVEIVSALRSRAREGIRVEPIESQSKAAQPQPFDLLGSLFDRRPQPQPAAGEKIALVYAVGPILPTAPEAFLFPQPTITPDEMKKILDECLNDETIKAVVLRIDSPGGDATASDVIWRQIRRLADAKPVVASMGDVAASGGYYIAMGAPQIVAQPGTITGSIGVLGGKVSLAELLQKINITTDVISRGKNAGILSVLSPFSESERASMQRLLVEIYESFTSKVAISRGMAAVQVEEVAQGRVWSGRQAFEAGLVDQLGGVETALAVARERAGLKPDAEVQVYPAEMSFQELLESLFTGGAMMPAGTGIGARLEDPALQALLPRVVKENLALLNLFNSPRPLTLMPFLISVQ